VAVVVYIDGYFLVLQCVFWSVNCFSFAWDKVKQVVMWRMDIIGDV